MPLQPGSQLLLAARPKTDYPAGAGYDLALVSAPSTSPLVTAATGRLPRALDRHHDLGGCCDAHTRRQHERYRHNYRLFAHRHDRPNRQLSPCRSMAAAQPTTAAVSTQTVALTSNGTAGTATYTANFATAGVHSIVAQYAGDSTHAASTGSVSITIAGTSSGQRHHRACRNKRHRDAGQLWHPRPSRSRLRAVTPGPST